MKQRVEQQFQQHERLPPDEVTLPPPLQAPNKLLGTPIAGFVCDEPDCQKLTTSRHEIRKHCYNSHNWKSSVEDPEHWQSTFVQAFFQSRRYRKYFTVNYDVAGQKTLQQSAISGSSLRNQAIIERWDREDEKREKELEIIDAETAKTDRTFWFKRNKWPEHLRLSNYRHLSRASRLPDRGEEVLNKVPQLVEEVIEHCVAGLPSLDHTVRRWLRSAKASEPDVRPLGRMQNPESQQRSASYITRLICYTFRVWQSCQVHGSAYKDVDANSEKDSDDNGGRVGEDDEADEDDDEPSSPLVDDTESDDIIDVYQDARRLFPWQEGQMEIVARLWEAIRTGQSARQKRKVLLEFLETVIFQYVRGTGFSNVLLHFLAVLGINEQTRRLRAANDFSYMLGGVVYCVRLVAIEIIMPKESRRTESKADDKRFLKLRSKHLADGSFSAMAHMVSLLAYSKHIALNHTNAGAISWSRDGREMQYRGQPISLVRFRILVDRVLEEAEGMLWRQLLWQTDQQRFEIPIDQLEDDVTFTKRGISFLKNDRNKLHDTRGWVLEQMEQHPEGRKLFRGEQWRRSHVRRYLRQVDRFRELLLLAVHMTGGQPARGTEVLSIRFKNGFMQDRNVFVIQGQMAVVTRYHKSSSQHDKPKVVPRMLPWRTGQLLAVYLAYVQPLQEKLALEVNRCAATDYVWASEHGPWETDRLTRAFRRETGKHLGVKLGTHDYRHVAISIGRRVVSESFANGYKHDAAADDMEEEEDDTDDPLEMSAGRGGEIGANRYGVATDVIQHLSSRSIDTFRLLSDKWHSFLGLSSCRPGGQKRLRNEADSSRWVKQGRQIMEELSPSNKRYQELPTPQQVDTSWHTAWDFLDSSTHTVEHDRIILAMRKALGREEVSYRSEAQQEALKTIVHGRVSQPLIVVMPTGGGKTLLFTAPACFEDPGVTIVVVPYRALLETTIAKAKAAGIDCIEWHPREVNPATIVFVSADLIPGTNFLGYAQQLRHAGMLRRIFIDECHLVFKDNHWRSKLAELKQLRAVSCPMILLTATLPPVMQYELERCMAITNGRYIRADTTRLRTRYMVEWCKAGTLAESAVGICSRVIERLKQNGEKGIVYCRSKALCEHFAKTLGLLFYHADADGKDERLQRWLEAGGLIFATSALGTGVDFPGVVFVLHVDMPYGMIDFAQESGRAGRDGEDVDSVILVEEGRVEQLWYRMDNPDERAMLEFVSTRRCRRTIQGGFLDGVERDCASDERGVARCDGCGEGWTALERELRSESHQRDLVERTLTQLRDACPVCWIHQRPLCREVWEEAGSDGTTGRRGWTVTNCSSAHSSSTYDRIREAVHYEPITHSCFKCGASQRFCRTGEVSDGRCQWPNVITPMLVEMLDSMEGIQVLATHGYMIYDQADVDEKAYAAWLGRRHPRRVLGEAMSNGFAVVIGFIVQRGEATVRMECPSEAHEDDESPVDSNWSEASDEISDGLRSFMEERERWGSSARQLADIIEGWEQCCLVCRAKGRRRQRHAWLECPVDVDDTAAVYQGVRHVQQLRAPVRLQGGRCWMVAGVCECTGRGSAGGCRWSDAAVRIGAALLFGGPVEVRRWVEQQEAFQGPEAGAMQGMRALEQLFQGRVPHDGRASNGLCEFIRRWGA